MKIKATSLSLIFLLAISSLTIVSADSMAFNPNHAQQNAVEIQQEKTVQTDVSNLQDPKQHQINLAEDLTINVNDMSQQEKQNDPTEKISGIHKTINLSERLEVTATNFKHDTVVALKQSSDRKTTMERIWNSDRIRFNGKSIVADDDLWSKQTLANDLTSLVENGKQLTVQPSIADQIENNAIRSLDKILFVQLDVVDNLISDNNIAVLFEISDSLKNNFIETIYDAVDAKNPTILLLLVPLTGYILIRSEEEKIESYNFKQILSFGFAVILISSAVLTPISISSSYWGRAYAEEMNGNNTTSLSGPIAVPDNSTITESIPDNSTITESIPDNSTITESIPDNSTITESIPDNSTITESIPDNSTITESIPDNSTITESIPDNSTITESIPDNSTTSEVPQTIPDATQSWQFDSPVEEKFVGDMNAEEGVNGTSLKLEGEGYVIENGTSTQELTALSLSVWAKPDYSIGSPEFTVISKEDAFVLAINNNISPYNIAKFSVFDGIKWSTVESTTKIDEQWTHLAATFNGTEISIYVNGNLESILPVIGIPTLAVNGKLKTSNVDSISSDSDIVIGAYLNSRKNSVTNQFSGLIDEIHVYDSLLDQSQISELYSQNVITDTADTTNATALDITNATALDITNATALDITNATALDITNATALDITNATALDITNATALDITNATALDITNATALDITNATALDITNATALDITNATALDITNATALELEISPELKPLRESYLITEDPAFEFQYYSDLDIIKKAEQQMQQTQQQIQEVGNNLNETISDLEATSGVEAIVPQQQIQEAQQQIQEAQQQIQEAQQQIQEAQQQIPTEEQIQETQQQIQEAQQQIQEAQQQIQETGDKIAEIENFTEIGNQIKEIASEIQLPIESVQQDQWVGTNETITVQILDPSGNPIDAQPELTQVLDGKFDITLSSTRDAQPGVYTIKTTLVKDGETYVVEDQFAWGLVSLNTKKSIYKPGETADFVIVVLNSTGNPVCDSNILMTITDPNLQSTVLSSGNGITPNEECGLYDAQYVTNSEGNYTVNISAETQTGIATFSTSFLVQQNFDYDIARTAESKIDPVNNPNSFDVTIDIESFTPVGQLTIREYVPRVFNIITDGNVEEVGDTKIITWQRDIDSNNKTSVSYKYSVPVVYPKLYALGKVEVKQDNASTFTEARNWFVAVDPTVTIDPTISGTPNRNQKSSKQIVTINSTNAYAFYVDANNDVVYSKTTNNGSSWGAVVTVSTTNASRGVAVWYDRWTPGDSTGNLIHIAVISSTVVKILYRNLDTSNDTLNPSGGTVDASHGGTEGAVGSGQDVTITKGTDGDVYVGTVSASAPTGGASLIEKCVHITSCTVPANWVNASANNPIAWDGAPTSDALGLHALVLLPLASGNIMLVSHHAATSNIQYKIYTNSSNTWSTDFTTIDYAAFNATNQFTLSGTVHNKTNVVYISYTHASGTWDSSEVKAAKYDGSWTLLTDPWANSTDTNPTSSVIFDSSIGIDLNSNNLYVAYTRNSSDTIGNVYYSRSSDNGTSWNIDNQINDLGVVKSNGISIPASSNDLLYAVWTDSQNFQLFGDRVAILKGLSESLPISDTLTKRPTKLLTETLPMSDSLTKRPTKPLSESLALSYTLTKRPTKLLSESLALSYTLTKSVTKLLTETLPMSDSLTKRPTKPLSESLALSDSLTKRPTKLLSESLALSYTLTKSFTKLLSESLTLSDNSITATKNIPVSLSESLTLSDTLTKTPINRLSESLTLSDTLTKSVTKQLTETFTMSTAASTAKTIQLSESLTLSDTLTKTPINRLSESLTLSDTLTKSVTKQLTETFTMSTAASTAKTIQLSESLTLSDTLTKSPTTRLSESLTLSDNPVTKSFTKQLSESLTMSTAASTAKQISLSESLALSDTLTKSPTTRLSESLTLSDNPVTKSFTKQLSESLTMSTAASTAKQISLSESLTISDTVNTTGIFFRNLSEKILIEAKVARAKNLTPTQLLVPYLVMEITVDPSRPELVITNSTMELSDIIIPPTVTNPKIDYKELLVSGVSTNNVTMISLLNVNAVTIVGVVTVNFPPFITISGPTSWSGTLNLPRVEPLGSVSLPSGTTAGKVIELGSDNSPLTFDRAVRVKLVGDAGKSIGYSPDGITFTEITTTCTADAQAPNDGLPAGGNCKINVGSDLVVWIKHFTKFVTFSSSSSSSAPSTGVASSTGGGGGRTGVGPRGAGAGFGGTLEPVEPIIPSIDLAAPKIFDVKFQLENGTKFSSSDTTSEYANSQSMSVYSIVDSPTPIKRAELRFIKIGKQFSEYESIVMDTKPLQVSNTTYTISATIPQRLMETPAIVYWIHVLNEDLKVQDSDRYSIGVKPDYPVDGNLELDVEHDRAAGTTAAPTAYFTNEGGEPIYGIISLAVDGKTVYTSQGQLFDVGQTAVKLEWKTPNVDQITTYQIQAKAEFYGKPFETETIMHTFPYTRAVSLSQTNPIEVITDQDGNTVATPSILYASLKDEGNMRYRVIAPDGTCVIGGSEECLVTQSTVGLLGNIKSIAIGDQIYRVRYSGPANPLERFSITSIDPILGQWQVEIDSEDGLIQQAHAMKDAFFKIKYRAQPTPFISEPSS